jgi:hypothetical protein
MARASFVAVSSIPKPKSASATNAITVVTPIDASSAAIPESPTPTIVENAYSSKKIGKGVPKSSTLVPPKRTCSTNGKNMDSKRDNHDHPGQTDGRKKERSSPI